MTPLWQILVCSVWERTRMLEQLLVDLVCQCVPYAGAVEVLVDRDNGDRPVGEKRTRLVEAATAGYVCFVDDDDHVADRYVDSVMDAFGSGSFGRSPDYVGFYVDVMIDGVPDKPAVHSRHNEQWWEDEQAYYRGISHLNPIRRKAALAGLPFEPGFGEDHDWADRVQASGLVRSEVFVPQRLYFYDWRRDVSLFSGDRAFPAVQRQPPLLSFPHVTLLP